MTVDDVRVTEVLAGVERLYDAGLVHDALTAGAALGPLPAWPGPNGLVMAGRLAMNLGAPRLGRLLHLRAHRCSPDDPQAAYYFARAVLERRGPLAAIQFAKRHAPGADASVDIRADWLGLRASMASMYRDFRSAERMIDEAILLAPNRPWVRIERAHFLESSDRYDEAMAAARQTLEMRPWFRPGVHFVAHLLQIRDRDDEALQLLAEAATRIQSIPVLLQLAWLQDHLKLYSDALTTLTDIDRLLVVREKQHEKSIAWLRSNISYHAGDFPAAIATAEAAGDEWLGKIAQKLREQVDAGNTRPRVMLPLPFVRQHHMTCAPATLTALSQFWNRPADHLELVDAICYDGTPSYSQRKWAVSNGWVTREFRFTWDVAVALIDRGIPFTLATVQIGSAHLQAVIGYDPMRGTVLCRDPYQYYETEFSAEMLAKVNAAFGPHCMVMLPESEAHRLDGIELPDAGLMDILHQVEGSLASHDRVTAAAARDRLGNIAPGHRLAFQADRALAAYDRDTAASLAALEGLIALHPDDLPLRLYRTYDLRTLDRLESLGTELAEACGKKSADPVFLHLYAEHLRSEVGDTPQVNALLNRALRRRPNHAASLATLGHVLWGRRRLDEATELYYLAACVDEKNEYPAQTYFIASRHMGLIDRALEMLHWRFDTYGKKSSQPGCTLAWAYEQLDRASEAMQILDKALSLRPDDGDLMLYVAAVRGRRTDLPRAKALLALARGKTRENKWFRSAAQIAEFDGNPAESLTLWRRVLETEPMADDANESVARLIGETESPDAAVKHMQDVCDRFPHSTALQQSRIVWLRRVGAEAVAAAARELVARRPGNVWARVELALALLKTGQAAEALEQAEAALTVSPNSSSAHYSAGKSLQRLGKIDQARGHFASSIRASVNYSVGIQSLVGSHADNEGRREALELVAEQLSAQGLLGDGLLTFGTEAVNVLTNARIETVLRRANESRPDVWQSWSALVRFLCDSQQLDAALQTAVAATERFSLLPRTWLDLASVHELRADRPGQIEALQHCLELSPAWSMASRQLSEAQQKAGDPAAATETMKKAVDRDPLDAQNHQALARLLWTSGEKAEAIATAKKAVLLGPWLGGMWDSLEYWTRKNGDPEEVVRLARDVCKRRAGEVAGWLILARMLRGKPTWDERFAAVNTALGLVPTHVDSNDLKATLLAEAKRWDEALAACDPPAFGGHPPLELRGRSAWVLEGKKDRRAAIERMREVLADNPNYYWGWRQLLKWLSEADDHPAYLEGANDMVGHFPHDALARNNLAHAQLAVKDRAAAKATLAQSMAQFPDDSYVLEKYFTVSCDDGQYEPAEKALELIRRHMSPEYASLCTVRLASLKGLTDVAARELRKLCLVKESAMNEAVTDAVDAMDKAGLNRAAFTVLSETCSDPGVKPEAVEVWTRRLAKAKQWDAGLRAIALYEDGSERWRLAMISHLDGLANTKLRRRVLKFIRRNQTALKRDTRLWGAGGFALISVGKLKACVDWCADWQSRADAKPWMLLNPVTCLRRLGRDAEAAAMGAHAITLPKDGNGLKHRLWLATDEVLGGGPGPHSKAVLKSDVTKIGPRYLYLWEVVRLLTSVSEPATAKAGRIAPTVTRELTAAFSKVAGYKDGPELRRLHRRAALRVAACRPALAIRIWAMTVQISSRFRKR